MTDPLIPEIVSLRGGLKAVNISHELLAITRRNQTNNTHTDTREDTDK